MTIGSNNGNAVHVLSFYRNVTVTGDRNGVKTVGGRLVLILLIIALIGVCAHHGKKHGNFKFYGCKENVNDL